MTWLIAIDRLRAGDRNRRMETIDVAIEIPDSGTPADVRWNVPSGTSGCRAALANSPRTKVRR
jgi:hypothetical protein